MAWQKIGSLGLVGDLEALRVSGCHTGPDGKPNAEGHGWKPALDDKVPAETLDRMLGGWCEEEAATLDRVAWPFDPDCKDCVREAGRYLRDERGVSREQWDRLVVALGRRPRTRRDPDKPSARDARYGFRQDGSYGEMKPWHLTTGTPDSPAAVRSMPRMSREFAMSHEYRAAQ